MSNRPVGCRWHYPLALSMLSVRSSVAVGLLLQFAIGLARRFTLVADLHGPGVTGSVVFTQDNRAFPVSIRTQLEPLSSNEEFGWHIHRMPVLWGYSDSDYCEEAASISQLMHNLTERHGTVGARAEYSDEFINLFSFEESIAGFSLILVDRSGISVACSTILPVDKNHANLKADFDVNVGGSVYFIPYFGPVYQKSIILGALYRTDGKTSLYGNKWFIGEENFEGSEERSCLNGSSGIGMIYNPYHAKNTLMCNQKNMTGCSVGDMESKHGPVYVGVSLDWSTVVPFSFKDSSLPLSGVTGVAWHPLYLIDSRTDEVLSCAIIKPVEELKFKSFLVHSDPESNHDTAGVVYFRQPTPYHSAFVKIRLKQNSNRQLEGGVPPTFNIFDVSPAGRDCSSIGTILYDNFGDIKSLLSPSLFHGYSNLTIHGDTLEVKFMSGFTLFGHKGILGKTVAVFQNFPIKDKVEACGQILPENPASVYSAIARFTGLGGLQGYVIFVQYLLNREFKMFSDVIIEIDLKHNSRKITTNHKYHVHTLPPGDDRYISASTAEVCSETDGHYNPKNVNMTQPQYENECGADFPARCEAGDLNGKHGKLDIGRRRLQFVDSNLELHGSSSIVSRSVVVHEENGDRAALSCASIATTSFSTYSTLA